MTETFELKPLHEDAIDRALAKAERYRMLNEPVEAESICLDIVGVDPTNQPALIALLLALTDQFASTRASGVRRRARDLVKQLAGEYERAYYAGIIAERQAKAALGRHMRSANFDAYDWLKEAMGLYEQADDLAPEGNDDARLRWNSCARMIMRHNLERRPADGIQHFLE